MIAPPSPIIVTGGAGFLGARLVRRLVALEVTVHLIVRPSTSLVRIADLSDRVTLHRGDLSDPAWTDARVQAIRPRTVFHIAASGGYGSRPAAALFADNVLATFHLLRATAGLAGCRFIHAASSLETGPRPVPIGDDDAFAPVVAFGAAKAAATLVARQAAAFGQPVVMLRPFTVYGPGEPEQRLVPTALRAALRGIPMRLTAVATARDMVFVDDVVDAFVRASTASGVDGELINVATGRATTAAELVDVVCRVTGRPIAIAAEPYPAKDTDTPMWYADVAKAERLLGWRAAHDLAQGLTATLAWHSREPGGRV